jgi:heme-degrading monooxygenase HmoA
MRQPLAYARGTVPATQRLKDKCPQRKGAIMLARIWHGVTLAEKADEYLDYLNRTGIPDYRATPGNRGAFVLRHVDGERAHFLTISLWDSLESIKRFAGEDYERARYYAEDGSFLLEFEPSVQHYEYYANKE